MRAESPESTETLYNLTCVHSLAGDTSKALDCLEELFSRGFIDVGRLETDTDLENLRQCERYVSQITSVKDWLRSYQLASGSQQFTVDVPPMMECYAIMLYPGNPDHPLITHRKNHPYFEKIDSFFADHKEHPLVRKLAAMYPGKPWQNTLRAHHNLRALYIYDGFDTSKIVHYPLEINPELAGTVREFALSTDFETFYKQNQSFYNAMKRIVRSNYSFGEHLIDFFNSNFVDSFSRFNFYFTPLWGGWQHGPSIDLDGYRECFYFGGCLYSSTREFYYPDQSLQFLALTEFDHATINPLTEKFASELEPLREKLALINTDESSNYGTLELTLNEFLTWAFALQFFYEHTPDEYPRLKRLVIQNMTSRKFARFDEFMTFYETYPENRDKYPKLVDLYPAVVNWLAELK